MKIYLVFYIYEYIYYINSDINFLLIDLLFKKYLPCKFSNLF